jgi:MtN3 and saliva related transmembrane protein
MLSAASIIGFLAGSLTTASNVPQVWKTYRDRSAEGLSFRMLLALASGLGLWVAYGLMVKSLPILVSNVAGFLLVASLLAMKTKFDHKPAKD